MQKILSAMRRAIQDYAMIEEGDKIYVGLSGGKDSVLLLNALAAYRRFSLCAKMRRGALNSKINELGGGKLALGHNADDVAETMLMSLLYEGRFSCFSPTAYMDKTGVALIRPFIYIEECDIRSAVERLSLPIVHNPCPMNHVTKREYVKDLIKTICKDIPFAKDRILGAIYHPERNNLWDKPSQD